MAHVEKRGARWVACYIDPDGKRKAKSHARKLDADRFLASVTVDMLRGAWVDPTAGRLTLAAYAQRWVAERDIRDSTRERYGSYLRHMLELDAKPLGRAELGALTQADMRTWQRHLRTGMADSTAATIRGVLAAILNTAVADQLIARSPLVGVTAPKVAKAKVRPMPLEHVHDIANHMTAPYRAAVWLGAGCGLRRGEAFGLTVEHVDFLRRTVYVERQLIGSTADHRPIFGPPKTAASVAPVPMPALVVDALAEHLHRYGTGVEGLIFRSARGCPATRAKVGEAWRDAEQRTTTPTASRFHDLRHVYASTLIAHGASVTSVQARMRHATAAETLDTYAHLWPADEDKTRAAIDAAFTESNTTATGADQTGM